MNKLFLSAVFDVLAAVAAIVAFVLFVTNGGQVSINELIVIIVVMVFCCAFFLLARTVARRDRATRIVSAILWLTLLCTVAIYYYFKFYMVM